MAKGSTCVPEVFVLILSRLDTKTNKLSSLHQTGLKNYGHGEGYAITAANLWSLKLTPFPVPPATLSLKYWGAQSACACVYVCAYVCVWMGPEKELWEKFPLTAVGRSGSTRAISFAHHVQLGLALSKEASVAN